MTDVDNDTEDFDDFDDFDDEDFDVDLSGGLPEEGDHAVTFKSAERQVNREKNNSKGISFGMEFVPGEGLEFFYVWLGNDEKKSRQGNQQLGAIIHAVTGERPPRNINLKDYEPYRKGEKVFLRRFEGAMVKCTVRHRENRETGLLEPRYTFAPLDED